MAFLGDGSMLLSAGWGGKAQLWAKIEAMPQALVERSGGKGLPSEFRQIAEFEHGALSNTDAHYLHTKCVEGAASPLDIDD